MIAAVVILGLVTLQRFGELVLARRNTKKLMAKGAVEIGARHYPFIVALHAAWLIGLWALAWRGPVYWGWVLIFLGLQALRVWVIATLGERWTTRIIVLPGAPLVTKGPFRFLPHPNYLVVAAELIVLPAAFGQWGFAALFTALNAVMMWVRIRAETKGLRGAAASTAAKL